MYRKSEEAQDPRDEGSVAYRTPRILLSNPYSSPLYDPVKEFRLWLLGSGCIPPYSFATPCKEKYLSNQLPGDGTGPGKV